MLRSFLIVALGMFFSLTLTAKELWRIGGNDGAPSAFALAPDQWKSYGRDPVFIVGRSEAARDWPYIHPGREDHWAGLRRHNFVIVFRADGGIGAKPSTLHIALRDTQSELAPRVVVKVNDAEFVQQLATGGGDASLNGDFSHAKPQLIDLPLAANVLHDGINRVSITITHGCWMIYNFVSLDSGEGAHLGALPDEVMQIDSLQALPVLAGDKAHPQQVLLLNGWYSGKAQDAAIKLDGAQIARETVKHGDFQLHFNIPAVDRATASKLSIEADGKSLATSEVTRKPVHDLTVYIVPHSHVDIGYTQPQPMIEAKQVANLEKAIDLVRSTQSNPEGSKFRWTVEASWTLDHFLQKEPADRVKLLEEALKKGEIELDGAYANELTGLCRPEELMRVYADAPRLAKRFGVPMDMAMISDVPGYTWGVTTAMAEAGIKYFSIGPNRIDRIGTTRVAWEDKPFYWETPDRQHRILSWECYAGYSFSHLVHQIKDQTVMEYLDHMQSIDYPYDISYVRWSGHGDNGVPDPEIMDGVKQWNESYLTPKLKLATMGEVFREFEKRHGKELPVVRGDWTPYWEDGAASSARETAINRATDERLVQAETLWAMLHPAAFPAEKFQQAWKNAMLYSEHTWGAWCSVSQPDSAETSEQWKYKQGYALQADEMSKQLLDAAIGSSETSSQGVNVYNTSSWPRSEVVRVSAELSKQGDCVFDGQGNPVAAQRLASGELVYIARDVPAMGARRYAIMPGKPVASHGVQVTETTLENERILVRIDRESGNIIELRRHDRDENFVDARRGGVNDYNYIEGNQFAQPKTAQNSIITIGDRGPVLGSLIVESDAAGCRQLTREIRLAAGADHVEIIDTLDKLKVVAKEAVHFGFPFNVPDGQIRIDTPWAVVTPEKDQIAGACKDWFTAQRFVDVSNGNFGITLATIDAPMIEVGGITATLIGSQPDPKVWRSHVEPTQIIYSYVMNNYWHTNYRASQDGATVFRYALQPHDGYSSAQAEQFAISQSQPLIVGSAAGGWPKVMPFTLSSPDLVVTSFKPADDGVGYVARVFNFGDRERQLDVTRGGCWISNSSEVRQKEIRGHLRAGPREVVTVRID